MRRQRLIAKAQVEYGRADERKKKWVEIGVAFNLGKQVNVILDSIPVNWNGECTLFPVGEAEEVPSDQG